MRLLTPKVSTSSCFDSFHILKTQNNVKWKQFLTYLGEVLSQNFQYYVQHWGNRCQGICLFYLTHLKEKAQFLLWPFIQCESYCLLFRIVNFEDKILIFMTFLCMTSLKKLWILQTRFWNCECWTNLWYFEFCKDKSRKLELYGLNRGKEQTVLVERTNLINHLILLVLQP